MSPAAPGDPATASRGPSPVLRARDAVAITVGLVLGAGIFRTPSLVAGGVGDGWSLMLIWAAGALIAFVGAVCYAELAAANPDAGGDYHFLHRAFGERVSFLYGWSRLAVIQTGSIAVLAFVFGDYLTVLFPLGPASPAIWAALAVVALTAINWAGVRQGAGVQTWLTLVEVAGLTMVIVAGLFFAPAAADIAPPTPPVQGSTSLGLAMVFVLLTYGGWNEAAFLSAELRGGGRRIGVVLLISLAVLALLYLLVNLAYLRSLGLTGMAASQAIATDVMRLGFGPAGTAAITVAVAIAALTSANATIITGGRSAYAFGRDVPTFGYLGRWHGPSGSPRNALLAQGAIALALVGAGAFARDGFRLAVEYTAPVFWFFFLLVGVSLFVLRLREPDAERPFRVPLYPLTPALFVAVNLYLLWSSLAYTGWGAMIGAAVMASGGALMLLPRTRFNPERTPS